jgi:UDP-glucose 4-epimerase
MHKVLITGGSGFIGSVLSYIFAYRGYNVLVWDLKPFPKDLQDKRITTQICDIMNKKKIPKGIDVVIHLAAQLEILDVDAESEAQLNLNGTLHMLELTRKAGIKKFIFASSASVYGEPELNEPTPENAPLKPFWSYGASKLAAEAYVQMYEELYGIKTVIIRPAIVTGEGEWYGRFVTLNMARLRRGESLLVFGNGMQTRDIVNVSDCARMFYESAIQDFPTPEIFNCGSGTRIMIHALAHEIINAGIAINMCNYVALANPCVNHIDPKVGELGRKPHELKNMCLSIAHAKAVLGWEPSCSLEYTLKTELRWIMGMNKSEFREWTHIARY